MKEIGMKILVPKEDVKIYYIRSDKFPDVVYESHEKFNCDTSRLFKVD